MTDLTTSLRERVSDILPDIEIKTIQIHQEGLVNDVVIVNDTWVVRFTRTEFARELMDIEYQLLDLLQSQLSLSIPRPEKINPDVLIYPHLKGRDFTREIWGNSTEDEQRSLAEQLGNFLQELHTISTEDLTWDLPHTLAPVSHDTWVDIHERLIERVQPLLLPHQIDWMVALFEGPLSSAGFFDFDPVLIHGELTPYHILYSPEERRLNAVIDFGTAGLGDPAIDLGNLISNYGESLVEKIGNTYPNYPVLLDRARFYAHASELQWVLLGVESGEDYWFTAHLGGARDIGFY
jgi:aminoglycoside 2''-phosphotransferase